MAKHILIHGSPTDGFTHVGPFDYLDDALLYAKHCVLDSWWVTELVAPLPDEDQPEKVTPDANANHQT
jgi:hypothetical protein